jgi:integrase
VAKTDLAFTYIAKGKYWRFRHKIVGDVALPHDPKVHWSQQPHQAAFAARYAELLAMVESGKARAAPSKKSFRWLIKAYQESEEFKALSDATQTDYVRTLRLLDEELGDVQFALATRAMLKAVRDDYAKTTRKAHKIKQMLSRLYSWAGEEDLVPVGFNPAADIKRLKRKGGDKEIVVWSDAEVSMFLAACPDHIRTPVLIALYTGQRREDVVSMTWQQFQGDIVRVRQSKTHALLDIACHSELRRHLESLPKRGVVICTTRAGKAFTVNGLSQNLRTAVAKVKGMPNNRSIHGLRYAAGSRMEEAGCTVAEIESVLGHETFKMALKYASQRLRAKAAVEKMEAKESSHDAA